MIFILLLIPGIFFYDMELKETVITSSVSPNGEHKIKVVEKGSPLTFGSSKVRIKSGWRFTNRYIANDGKRLNPSNVSIEWKSNDVALITLSGEEQQSATIEYNAKWKKFVPPL